MTLSAPAAVEAALASILRGDAEEGFTLYRQSFGNGDMTNIPVGLHIRLLEQAGRPAEAARLRELAISYGADLAVRAGSFLGAQPALAAEEYEAIFDRGFINSRMVFEYLKVLAALGRMEDHSRLVATDTLYYMTMLDRPAPNTSALNLAAAVDEVLLGLEHSAEHQESAHSVRQMKMVRDLTSLGHPVMKALFEAIEAETAEYLERWSNSAHPLANHVPTDFDLCAWGLISRGEGYNTPHIHHHGWVTGLFYPRSVDCHGGDLVVGRPEGASGSEADWGSVHVRPEAGLLVLMPSFYTHWTIPLQEPGLRTSVAFDIYSPPPER